MGDLVTLIVNYRSQYSIQHIVSTPDDEMGDTAHKPSQSTKHPTPLQYSWLWDGWYWSSTISQQNIQPLYNNPADEMGTVILII